MNIRKLTQEEFARAIKNGLGSAYLHVKEYGDNEIQNELLRACIENLVFDTQINSGRGLWLVEMLQHTGQIKKYACEIRLKLLENPKDEATVQQLIDLAAVLFDKGFGEFKEILLNLSVSNQSDEAILCLAEALVDVASFSGLETGVRKMKELPSDSWIKKVLYEYASEELGGAEEVNSFLKSKSKLDIDLSCFWETVQKDFDPDYVRQSPPTLNQVLDSIQADCIPFSRYKYQLFGKTATTEELQTILSLIDREVNPNRLAYYMEIFALREIPTIPSNAREMLFSKEENLQRSARNALSKIKSPVLRELAIELLQSETDRNIVCGLILLELNYTLKDLELIGSWLQLLDDIDWVHWGAMSVSRIAENDNTILTKELIWICEFNPCGFCRRDAFEKLLNTNRAPEQLTFEAQWDAERDIRILARGNLVP